MVDVRKNVINHGINSKGELVAMQVTENGGTNVGNAYKKFRDGFASLAQDAAPNPAIWTGAWTNQGTGFAGRRGDAEGSSYICVSMDPTVAGSEYVMESAQTFKFPMRPYFGVSISKRIVGQEVEISVVDESTLTPKADIPISGDIVVLTNVATVNFAAPHGLVGGARVILKNNADSRMNFGPVTVTVTSPTQITVPFTVASATYTAGGSVQWADQLNYSKNGAGILFEVASVTTGLQVSRRNGFNTKQQSRTSFSTTVAVQTNTSAYSDSFNSASRYDLKLDQEEYSLATRLVDSVAETPLSVKFTQGLPDEEENYKLRFRVKNLENISRPVARIVSATKTGATTATIVTDAAHGLNAFDQVQIYGVRDQTNFPNLTASTAIASIVDATTFTIIIGPAVSIASAGGTVFRVNGGVLAPGVLAQVVQSISRTSNVMTLIGSGTWATPLPGENFHLYGCDATSMGLYDGPYKVLRVSTTTLELESVGPDFGSINCGGAIIRRTDARLHFVAMMEYTRLIAELAQSSVGLDESRAMPVTAFIDSGTVTAVTTSGMQVPVPVADITSAALTTTTTTAAVTPAQGVGYQVNVPVTAVSGTNPTLDLSIEESDDAGTNWVKVYDFPRITATGIYRSPVIQLTGTRVRYVQTVGGTSPSFTRSLNRLQAHAPSQYIRQLVDRTIVPNTLNSTSGALVVHGLSNFNISIRCTAQTTPATIALQFSHDNVNWHSGTTVATISGIAHGKVQNEKWSFVRALVSVAGTGITLAELIIVGSNT